MLNGGLRKLMLYTQIINEKSKSEIPPKKLKNKTNIKEGHISIRKR